MPWTAIATNIYINQAHSSASYTLTSTAPRADPDDPGHSPQDAHLRRRAAMNQQTRAAAEAFFASCTLEPLTRDCFRELLVASEYIERYNLECLAKAQPAVLHDGFFHREAEADIRAGFAPCTERISMSALVHGAVQSMGASGAVTVDLHLRRVECVSTPDGAVGLLSTYVEDKDAPPRGARDTVELRQTMLRKATDGGWKHDLTAEDMAVLSSWMFWDGKCERAVAHVVAAFEAHPNVVGANGVKVIAVAEAECPGIYMPFMGERFNDEARIEHCSQPIVSGKGVTSTRHFAVIAAALTGELYVYDPTAAQYTPHLVTATTPAPIQCAKMRLKLRKEQVVRLLRKESTLVSEIVATATSGGDSE